MSQEGKALQRQGHREDFMAFFHNLACPVENELTRGGRRDAIASARADEDWEFYVVFQRADLLTYRKL